MDNANFGHTSPICILPNGIKVRVDLNNKEIVFLEKPMNDIIHTIGKLYFPIA